MTKNETTILTEMNRTMGEVVGEVKGINKRLDKMNGSNARRDIKIDDLETSRDVITGKVTIVGAICGFIGAVIIACFKFFQN